MSVTPVSTMHDVIANVIALLTTTGDVRTPSAPDGFEALIGERYLREEGAPPRVIFVPTLDGGKIGPVLEIGARQVGSIRESVRCYVWGSEGTFGATSDATRYDAAAAICVRLLNAFQATAAGRITGGDFLRSKESNVVTFGEEYQMALSYEWPAPYAGDIWNAAYALAPSPALSPPNPDQPQGDTGLTFGTGAITFEHTR